MNEIGHLNVILRISINPIVVSESIFCPTIAYTYIILLSDEKNLYFFFFNNSFILKTQQIIWTRTSVYHRVFRMLKHIICDGVACSSYTYIICHWPISSTSGRARCADSTEHTFILLLFYFYASGPKAILFNRPGQEYI